MNKHMKALHIRFLPEQATEENISSREFIKQAEFINVDSLQGNGSENSSSTGGNGSSTGSETGGGSSESGSGSDIPPVINP